MCKLPVSEDPHLWPVLQTGSESGNSESAGNNKQMAMINIVKKVRIHSMLH